MIEIIEKFELLLTEYQKTRYFKEEISSRIVVSKLFIACNIAKLKYYNDDEWPKESKKCLDQWFDGGPFVAKYFDNEWREISHCYGLICTDYNNW